MRLTAVQEASKEVQFVFDELPTNKQAVNTLILDELKTEEHVLIGLQRLRDFYNPLIIAAPFPGPVVIGAPRPRPPALNGPPAPMAGPPAPVRQWWRR